MPAEVPVGEPEQGLEIGEGDLPDVGQHREDSETGPMVHDVVEDRGRVQIWWRRTRYQSAPDERSPQRFRRVRTPALP